MGKWQVLAERVSIMPQFAQLLHLSLLNSYTILIVCLVMLMIVMLHCEFIFYTSGPNRLEYLRGMLELRPHFETTCGSCMGGNTLESTQQWCPSNLTVDVTILPKDIRRTGNLCCSLHAKQKHLGCEKKARPIRSSSYLAT